MSILFSQTKCGENTSLEVTVMRVLVPLSNGSLRRTRAFFSELNMRQLDRGVAKVIPEGRKVIPWCLSGPVMFLVKSKLLSLHCEQYM